MKHEEEETWVLWSSISPGYRKSKKQMGKTIRTKCAEHL